jgi:hypothetical protein
MPGLQPAFRLSQHTANTRLPQSASSTHRHIEMAGAHLSRSGLLQPASSTYISPRSSGLPDFVAWVVAARADSNHGRKSDMSGSDAF